MKKIILTVLLSMANLGLAQSVTRLPRIPAPEGEIACGLSGNTVTTHTREECNIKFAHTAGAMVNDQVLGRGWNSISTDLINKGYKFKGASIDFPTTVMNATSDEQQVSSAFVIGLGKVLSSSVVDFVLKEEYTRTYNLQDGTKVIQTVYITATGLLKVKAENFFTITVDNMNVQKQPSKLIPRNSTN